ncbi:unnamed protein product [Cyclocybe aegerita]|uniref:Uncharacterized protein n=1 Tax=Cyclocybe aegerita TaxID=1973307 RepID=A0A8S0VSU6_CYCAE|nr:unnamed protein product [Cyclocybe aegerita]
MTGVTSTTTSIADLLNSCRGPKRHWGTSKLIRSTRGTVKPINNAPLELSPRTPQNDTSLHNGFRSGGLPGEEPCGATFIFFGSGRADGRYLKSTIALLWIADTVHEALIAHTLYIYISSSYHNRAILYRPPWSTLVQMYFAAASDFAIRLIYSRRIYILLALREKKTLAYLLVAIINLLSIASTGKILSSVRDFAGIDVRPIITSNRTRFW